MVLWILYAEGTDLQEEEKKGTSCGVNNDTISRDTGLLLIDAGCREKGRQRRVGSRRQEAVQCLHVLVYEQLCNLQVLFACVCVCCLTQHVCLLRCKSATPKVPLLLMFCLCRNAGSNPKEIGIKRRGANECRSLTV